MLSARVARREDLTKAPEGLPRQARRLGTAAVKKNDKAEMGGHLAYIKERSRKRAAAHLLSAGKENHARTTWAVSSLELVVSMSFWPTRS